MIKVNDIVYHTLSHLYFRCENKKHEKWMNMNPYFIKTDKQISGNYFKKEI